jgi:hypothetical protein
MNRAMSFTILAMGLAVPCGAEDFFADRIAPLLKQRCFECHSHESGKMKGGLTLDSKPGWAEGGEHGPAVLPGEPENSLLVRMVRWTDADHQMPPDEPLPADEIALLEEWIKRGAPDPRVALVKPPPDADWWSLRPLVAPPVPAAPDPALTHPIDRFIQARLAAASLRPAPRADARTLIRRVTQNLNGLPPTPEETEAFVRESAASPVAPDGSSPAWLAVVDRLLASPRYGERWARHWLDTIHFADTHGFEHDVHRPNAWRFRDHVIDAFNQDTRWPRFIEAQLAADVLFPADTRLTAALGFLGAGPFDASAEGTAPAAYEYVDRDDLVTQTMGSFVSTTANCARCHDHKFDPITQEDYFSLQAVFAGVGKGNVVYDEDPAAALRRRQWSAVLDASDAIGSHQPEVLLTAENEALVAQWEAAGGGREPWQTLSPDLYSSAIGAVLTRLADGSLLSSGPRPDTETYTLTVSSPPREISALRIDLLTDESLPLKGPGRLDNGNLHLSGFEAWIFRAGGAAPEKIGFTRVLSDFDQAGYAAPTLIDGDPKTSWAIHPRVGEPHHAILTPSAPLAFADGDRLVIALQQLQGGQHLLGRFRLAATAAPSETLVALPAAAQAALLAEPGQRPPESRLALAAAVLHERARQELARLPAQVEVYAASAANQAARGAILKAPQPRTIHILKRGDLDKPGVEAGPGALSAITALNARFPSDDPHHEGARRAALAGWITHRDNPLTWRSAVNRVWHYHFGIGLCDTPSDFGRMGGIPSHPELLDWLAVWFRDEAQGSLKALHRLIVTSATWQQSSALPPPLPPAGTASPAPAPGGMTGDPQATDPDNRLLWRMNRSRLDADSYRDAVMAASGRLDLTMGGPGIPLYNASPGPQSTPVLDYAGFDWEAPAANRRSIYRVVYRGIADPFMEVLDFPDMGLLSPTRGFSVSALQSLTLFNNHFLLGQSAHLAARAAGSAQDPPEAIRQMFRLVLLREPTAGELAEFAALAQSAGLPAAARVLFNTNEFLFID